MPLTVDDLQATFLSINETLFDGLLPPVIIRLHDASETRWLGYYRAGRPRIISLRQDMVAKSAAETYLTIAHEAAHVACEREGAPPGHGSAWERVMLRIGLEPNAEHTVIEGGAYELWAEEKFPALRRQFRGYRVISCAGIAPTRSSDRGSTPPRRAF